MITVQNPATLLPLQELKSVNTQTGEEVTVAQLDLNQIRVLNHLVKDEAYTDNTGNDYISVDFPMPVNKYSFKINVNSGTGSNIPIITDAYFSINIDNLSDTVPTGSIPLNTFDFNDSNSSISISVPANNWVLVIDSVSRANSYVLSFRNFTNSQSYSIQSRRYYKVVNYTLPEGVGYGAYVSFYGTNGIVSGKYYFSLRDTSSTDAYASFTYISTDLLLFSLPSE